MKFTFVHISPFPFDGNSRKTRPMGGTETALIGVAESLAKIPGNEIHIFTITPEVVCVEGVNYHPINQLGQWSLENETDVLLTIRQWLPLWFPIKSKFKIYFSPDAFNQPFLHRAFALPYELEGERHLLAFYKPEYFFDSLDAIFTVGKWQAETFVKDLSYPQEKVFPSANGVFLEYFNPLPLAKRKPHLMYSATPFRGLNHLINLFPKIKENVPQAKLEVCSGMGAYGTPKDEDVESYGVLYQGLEHVGAISHGSILQKDLAKIMCAARIYAYPNTFAETFCISVLEAQAAGLPVVTTARGALSERVEHGVDGFLIHAEPGTPEYDQKFIEYCTRLMTDDKLWQEMSAKGIEKAKKYTYDKLAESWMSYIEPRIAKKEMRMSNIPRDAVEPYLCNHPTDPTQKIRFQPDQLKAFLNDYFSMFGFGVG